MGPHKALNRLQQHLKNSASMVLIWGEAGIGKTHLARQLQKHTQVDVLWIEATRLESLEQLSEHISIHYPGDQHTQRLDKRWPIVIIDHVDHLDGVEQWLFDQIANTVQHAQIILTRRQMPQHHQTTSMQLLPLDNEKATRMFESMAAQFTQEALDTHLVQGMLRHLAGNPLAIELAARRLSMCSLFDLLEDLTNAHGAQPILHHLFERSWAHLAQETQGAMISCALFFDEFTMATLDTICHDQHLATHVEQLVQHLWIRAWTQDKTRRFKVPSHIKQFVLERFKSDHPKSFEARRDAYVQTHLDHLVWWSKHPDQQKTAIYALHDIFQARQMSYPEYDVTDPFIRPLFALLNHHGLTTHPQLTSLKDPKYSTEDLIQEAKEDFRRGHHANAISKLQRAYERSNANRDLQLTLCMSLGRALRRMSKYSDAADVYERAVEHAAVVDHLIYLNRALYYLAMMYRTLNDVPNTVRVMEQQVALLERHTHLDESGEMIIDAQKALSAHFLKCNDLLQAKANCQRAIFNNNIFNIKQKKAPLALLEGCIEQEIGNATQAQRALREATQMGDVPIVRQAREHLWRLSLEHNDIDSPDTTHVGAYVSLCKGWEAIKTGDSQAGLAHLQLALKARELESTSISVVQHLMAIAQQDKASAHAQWRRACDYGIANHTSGWLRCTVTLLETIFLRRLEEISEEDAIATLNHWRTVLHPEIFNDEDVYTGGASKDFSRAAYLWLVSLTGQVNPLQTPGLTLQVAQDGKWFQAPGKVKVVLGRKKLLRRLLMAIVNWSMTHETPITTQDLIEAGWPDEPNTAPEAALNRLHVALNRLRGYGLAELIIFHNEGYWLNPDVHCEIKPE